MLISDYLSSNILFCIFFFYLAHFRELGQKYKNIFVRFLVQMKTSRLIDLWSPTLFIKWSQFFRQFFRSNWANCV